jgi:Holliday junction resolvase
VGITSRRKGARVERELARQLQDNGFAAEKISRAWTPGHDISLPLLGRDLRVEVKSRKEFKTLQGYIDKGADLVLLKPDRCKPLVLLPWDLAMEIARKMEGL